MYLCLVAIFKNESHIMKEWIDHYLKQGVDKFLLIDNGSTDSYFHILKPYLKKNIVSLIVDPMKHKQEELYNTYYLNESKKYKWALVCDLDEFIYARNGFSSIKTYLKSVKKAVSQIYIPWKVFGSSGYDSLDKKQPDSIIKSFTKRINYDKNDNFQGLIKEGNYKYSFTKCIVRTKSLKTIGIHSHTTIQSYNICTDGTSAIHSKNTFAKIDENILKESALHLNHYAIQSFDWFMRVKATRGDSNSSSNDSARDESYFRRFDSSSNDVDDNELLLIYNN
jgi:hypothetical protein